MSGIEAKGILVIHDDLDDVHIIATNPEDALGDWAWLRQYLRGDETMQWVEFDPAREESGVQVWPDLSAFARQFDITIDRDTDD